MTKGYLLDTNIVSYLVCGLNHDGSTKGINVLKHYRAHENNAAIFICAAVTGEIEYGLKVAPSPSATMQQEVRNVLGAFPVVLALDKHIASNQYAALRSDIFKKYATKNQKYRAKTRYIEEWCDPATGKSLGVNENDVWIVAVSLAHNLTLVTADKMDHIKAVAPAGFSVLNWTSP